MAQKACQILSIITHDNNMRCNLLQTVVGFFLQAKNVLAVVCQVATHSGWSLSEASIATMIKSVRNDHKKNLKLLYLAANNAEGRASFVS